MALSAGRSEDHARWPSRGEILTDQAHGEKKKKMAAVRTRNSGMGYLAQPSR
jgi:hypothetical protein